MKQVRIPIPLLEINWGTDSKDQVMGMTPVDGSAMALNAPTDKSSELRFLHLFRPCQSRFDVTLK